MISSNSGVETGRFACSDATADAHTAGLVREKFAGWLRRIVDVSETRLCDVVLAVNEALANVAEFAYLREDGPGTFDLEAVLGHARNTVTVTISDRGHWRAREVGALGGRRTRGRGIQLMRALADTLVIDTSMLGTSVCMRFDNIHATGPVEVVGS